jgi:hypothetical protein
MEDDYLTQAVIGAIVDRYEMEEILDILNIDAESLVKLLNDQILDNLDRFDVPNY